MNSGQTVFSQLIDHLSLHSFHTCVRRYNGNHRARTLTCLDLFLAFSFAQLTYRESLRDIVACLNASPEKLYHMGIRGRISRSTLSDANEKRDWRIYQDMALVLIATAQKLLAGQSWGRNLGRSVYAFDSSTIDLCLSLFPWATFRKTKAAVKVHTLFDVVTKIPVFIRITEGSVHDVKLLDQLPIEPGAVYLFDRGYIDFQRLFRVTQCGAFFVTRAKKSFCFIRQRSRKLRDDDVQAGIKSDQEVYLTHSSARKDYPDKLRRVRFVDPETGTKLTFLTNNFDWPASTVALLYKSRWQVELFFKWIKQHLRIKVFYGTSENAVKSQIWIAVSTYVLVAIVKKRLNLTLGLYQILQILSINVFEKVPLEQLLTETDSQKDDDCSRKALTLFD